MVGSLQSSYNSILASCFTVSPSARLHSEVDAAVAHYVNTLYQEGDSLAQAGHFLSGLKRFLPHLRLRLPTSSQNFRN